jgi:hypothetical protein
MANVSFWDAPNRTAPDPADRTGLQRNQTNAGEHITLRQVTDFVFSDAETVFAAETDIDGTEFLFVRKAGDSKKVTVDNLLERYDYSSAETNTKKKFINGKPIYRKYIGSVTGLANNASIALPIGANVDTLVKCEIFCKSTTGNITIQVPHNPSGSQRISWEMLTSTSTIFIRTNYDASAYNTVYAIVEYTKV